VWGEWSGVDRLAQEVFTWGRIEELQPLVLNSVHHVLHEDVAGLHHRRSKWAGERTPNHALLANCNT
jgi:hypothetical protein